MFICTHCGWEGERKRKLRGSKTVEVLIWTTLLLPGPIYSVWRRTGSDTSCPHCHLPMLVKLNSDAGWLAKRKFDMELGVIPQAKPTPKPDDITVFGNTNKPAATPTTKKLIDPEQW